ncbi:hypothetical protein [Mycoplasmopsis gallinacea]|uniref:Uncharacterized protein n=1 Tax=Mycoplasmopsis gallinacea TaxID=29556 RepID=A0A6H0V2F0_9BACT|nr:hypothetical protein [Mycoplasmopsis gallinacea]QIW62520.1 hypothetical protein GOQ20_03820 [Mycoplasmopsis gallinacea]
MKIIDLLSQKFNLSVNDVLKSLELSPDYKQIDLLKSLGIYSMFETKDQHEEYIKNKLKNYHDQIASRENESKEKDQRIQDLENLQNQTLEKLNSVINNEIQKLNFYGNVKAQDLDFNELDFQNLKGSILNQAKQKKLNHKRNRTNRTTKTNKTEWKQGLWLWDRNKKLKE